MTHADRLRPTLGSEEWLRKHEEGLRKLLPDTWTHAENLNGLRIGYGLKILGVDWRTDDEFANIMIFLEKMGIMQRRNGYQIRANHLSIFQ